MAIEPPNWLQTWADASAVLLLIELIVLLVIVTALVGLLAFGARWLKLHVVPVLNETVPRAQQALHIANEGSDRVVRGVAEVYGVRQALEVGFRVLWRGRQAPPAAPGPSAAARIVEPFAPEAAPERRRTPADGDRGGLTAHAG